MELQDRMIVLMIQGFTTSYLLYTACELSLFDYLYHEKMGLAKLSNASGVQDEILYRLLRPLIALQLIKVEGDVFCLTPLGEKLAKNAEHSLQGLVLFCGRESMECWSKLYEAVKGGNIPYMLVEKKAFFEAQQTDETKFSTFNSMMRNSSKNLDLFPYFGQKKNKNEVSKIVDIGGGAGDIIAKFLDFYSGATGVIIDLAHVKNEARQNLSLHNVNQRCKFEDGNFFESIDVQADLFILSRILHDWEDEKACAILRNIRKAMPDNSTLLVIEKIMPDAIVKDYLHLYMNDLYIWSMCGGKERTEEEFSAIFNTCGLVLRKKYKLPSDEYVLEVVKGYFEEGILC